jgi:DNA helicase-2/ATP-dependent DNA helicase PcrA
MKPNANLFYKKDGPMIIIGAGSWKTRVLTIRIAYLMHQGVDDLAYFHLRLPIKRLVRWKKRISDIVGAGAKTYGCTFHSVLPEFYVWGWFRDIHLTLLFTIRRFSKSYFRIIKEMQLDRDVYKLQTGFKSYF